MEITEVKQANYTLLELIGRIDAANAPDLEGKVVSLIDGGATSMVLDFAQLEYVSSAGLRVFLLAAKKLKRANGKLALAAVPDNIKHVFDLAGFTRMFTFFPTREEAIQGVG